MTIKRRDGNDTPFSNWVRAHPELDSVKDRLTLTDSDYWFHQYRAHKDKVGERMLDSIMLVELKTFSKDASFSQRDTLNLVSQLLRLGCNTKPSAGRQFGRRRIVPLKGSRPGEVRYVRCYGVHVLQLSGDSPTNSNRIVWDHVLIDEACLVGLLKFERDPDNPLRDMSFRRHHTPLESPKYKQLVLINA